MSLLPQPSLALCLILLCGCVLPPSIFPVEFFLKIKNVFFMSDLGKREADKRSIQISEMGENDWIDYNAEQKSRCTNGL